MRKKVAIINQRYGAEVNGGSEYYTKKLAEHLAEYYDVEVVTTTALDYDTWEPYYETGIQEVDGVRVRRFDVEKTRNIRGFRLINKLVRTLPWLWKLLESVWIKAQGPYCPELIQYIETKKDSFDVFIFVTYLYYTTVAGLPKVAEKAVLVPTAHDEYCIYFHRYETIFKSPKGIAYLTKEEKQLVERLFHNESLPHQVVGTGIDPPDFVNSNVDMEYVLYVGRVDSSKNCDELFEYFTRFKEKHRGTLKLLVVGKLMMKKPESKEICCLGFVSEEEKYGLIAGAKVLIMPSKYESLSLVVLEAMTLGTPVLVNGGCDVLAGHCEKSGAGICYTNYAQFEDQLEFLFENEEERHRMRVAGEQYMKENYSWETTVRKYREIIEK